MIFARGGYLYQHLPDYFPEGKITPIETLMWKWYYDTYVGKDKK